MAAAMIVARTVPDLRAALRPWRAAGETVALVPTMGALHEGHLSLVRLAGARCRRVVVTLFVNPKQFDRAEDLAAYPRTEAEDAAKLAPLGVDLLFAPPAEVVYPPGFATTVSVRGVSEHLDGLARPGHFDGVATVVTKLLLQSLPDVAVFGEKDWQQLQVIRRLASDLDIPVEILAGPTVRAADGLALSSRNAYLTPEERRIAPALHAAMQQAAARIRAGEDPDRAAAAAVDAVLAAGFARVDYLELRDAETLAPVRRLDRPARLFAAAWLGKARLIDNIAV